MNLLLRSLLKNEEFHIGTNQSLTALHDSELE
jgi:hypothetical protein